MPGGNSASISGISNAKTDHSTQPYTQSQPEELAPLPHGYALLIEEYFDQLQFFKILLICLAVAYWLVLISTRIQMFQVYRQDTLIWRKDLGMLFLQLGLWVVTLSSVFKNEALKAFIAMLSLVLISH